MSFNSKRNKTYKIGITGTLASGKTLVRKILQRAGVNVMDWEDVAFNTLADNPHRLSVRITDHFGADVMDSRGRFSRKKLANVLYANPKKKEFFDELLEPVVREEIKKFLYSPIGSHIRAIEVPNLFETDSQHLYDEVWIVTITPEFQVNRLMARDSLSREAAQKLLTEQSSGWSQEDKVKHGQRVIDNAGEIHRTEAQVRGALDEIKKGIFSNLL